MVDPDNPFAALLEDSSGLAEIINEDRTSNTIEGVFGFTLNRFKRRHLVFLEELWKALGTERLNLDTLEHALFERTLLEEPRSWVDEPESEDICETQVLVYLFACLKKANTLSEDAALVSSIKELITRNAVTALKQPTLHCSQDLGKQFYQIFKAEDPLAANFFEEAYKKCFEDEDGLKSAKESLTQMMGIMDADIAKASLETFPPWIFIILNSFCTNETMALLLLDYCQPQSNKEYVNYSKTLLGAVLNISFLPKNVGGEYKFFVNPLDQASNTNMEGALWMAAAKIQQEMHALVKNLLKCSQEVKVKTVKWLGNCLKANADKAKLWTNQAAMFAGADETAAGDGFMINFNALLLKLYQPVFSNVEDKKILKVDPTYCAVPEEESEAKEVHLPYMWKETCLVPQEEDDDGSPPKARFTAATYGFVTECFFMTHRAIELGYRDMAGKLSQLNQEMSRIEMAYRETQNQGGSGSDVANEMKYRMSKELTKFLSIKCALSEPNLLEDVFNFLSASAFWLVQVALHVDLGTTPETFAPLNVRPLAFPLSSKIPETLKCIPEFVVENIVTFLIFLKRFNPKMFEQQGCEKLKPFLSFILVYMGSAPRTRNPHLRAHMAEALESLLPYHKDEPANLNTLGGIQREKLFVEHEHRAQIVTALLDVFVGIEMTGQNVQFEQKFNYRRPMYIVMDYLWEMNAFKGYFRQLAEEAERNMEAVTPPLFLRFVNLLINDAIFLLDESLSNMAKLREMETARDRGEWDRLPLPERVQTMQHWQHTGMLARFDNILGRDTIRTMENLTSHITIVFTHTTMVERVASMLNYFLMNLVGPNQKNFKVKDQKEYNFDPAATVLDICKIYVNLKESDTFCLAISQDGRSYSPQLFTLAEDVLVRIGGGLLVSELQEVAKKVSQKALEYQTNEEAIAEAPDHFLDPIMSTLMTDPVILPSSRTTVDRSTIARHLLSDQTDPFNRAPLSMDQVIPNTELLKEIKQWLEERNIKR